MSDDLPVPPSGGAAAASRPSAAAAGRVTLVGAGPGDPELLTLKAVRALQRATVALVDDLVHPDVLAHLPPAARVLHVGKRGGRVSTPQAFIERLMATLARRGEQVVRLKGGDPFVFGRGGEECDALRARGIEVEVVGGLTAGVAAPAAIGVPVTDRRHAPGVALVTGHARDGGPGPDWAALARSGLTLVIYMGVARLAPIVEALRAGGLPAHTPAAVVQAAHTPSQRHALCTLGTLAATVAEEDLRSPAIVVVGDVVRAAPQWAQAAGGGGDASRVLPSGGTWTGDGSRRRGAVAEEPSPAGSAALIALPGTARHAARGG